MAEFLLHRDPMMQSSTIVLQCDNPTYGAEKPYDNPCAGCPVANTEIPNGCTRLSYNSYTKEVSATMPTEVEGQCGIVRDASHTTVLGNDEYDIQSATYLDKKLLLEVRSQVRQVIREHEEKNNS